MKEKQDPLEALHDIRNMMERSSRFIALSGRAGIIAGLITLIGTTAGYSIVGVEWKAFAAYQFLYKTDGSINHSNLQIIAIILGLIFSLSVITACLLAAQNARKKGIAAWDVTTRRVVFHFAVPLLSGALVAVTLLYHHYIELIAPSTLIFYGLAHVNISKYTIDAIRNFGIVQILLGLIGMMYMNYGVPLWIIGFGVIHIIYGAFIYFKYEK